MSNKLETTEEMTEEMLEVGAAGLILGVTGDRVRQLADEGVLPIALRTSSGTRIFKKSVVKALQAERARKAGKAVTG
jgi:DNA-binding transcriptional MerR regulator